MWILELKQQHLLCAHSKCDAGLDDRVERIKSVAASSRELRGGLDSNWIKYFKDLDFL